MAAYPEFPSSFGVVYFPGFEVLDIAGPLECLNDLSRRPGFEDMHLSIISKTLDPVTVGHGDNKFMNPQQYVPTHTFATAPQLDVLIVPGGYGASPLPFPNGTDVSHIQEYIDFVRDCFRGTGGRQPLKYIISVCNGATILNLAGVLEGQKATTNKDYFNTIVSFGPKKTHWIAKARWVGSGRVWTTSGVSAGTDGTLAWMETLLPAELVHEVVKTVEWRRAENADDDPFAEGLEDVLPSQA